MEHGKLGNAIRKKRIEAQLTQEQLAELVGVTPTHLKHLESEHRMPSVEVLFRLAETLQLSLDELLLPAAPGGRATQRLLPLFCKVSRGQACERRAGSWKRKRPGGHAGTSSDTPTARSK